MKRWIAFFITILTGFVLPAGISASTLIHLKNGASIATNHFWEDTGQIKFYRFGGEVSISKDMIHKIEELNSHVSEEQVDSLNKVNTGVVKNFQNREKRYQTDLRRIILEREVYSNDFRKAKKRNDQNAKDEAWNRLTNLQTEYTDLRVAVEALYGGSLPQWWDESMKNID